ncbi:MAG TPA: 50S ribosomal protein L17 [Polyangiaceae bacterium]|jgi:large subunit ribosomal protein L17
MRHRKAGRQFGRNTSHRRAMLRALTANLVAHERIETTDAKAKELRRVAERLITRAIRLGPVAYTPHDKLSVADRARRQSAQQHMGRFLRRFSVVQKKGGDSQKVDLIEKVFVDLAKRFKTRPGGYTRIIKLGRRRGDNAAMSLIEFVDQGEPHEAGKVTKSAEAKAPKAKKAGKSEAAEATATKKPRASKAKKAEAEG